MRSPKLTTEDTKLVTSLSIIVIGAGVLGLWQALTLARLGYRVRLVEASAEPFADAASLYGGVMLAPDREAKSYPPIFRRLGREGMTLWRAAYPDLSCSGGLVVASARDRSDLERFARDTQGHETLDATKLVHLEPELAGRFASALYFADEAHMAAPAAMKFLLDEARGAGSDVSFGVSVPPKDADTIIDCRGLAARDALANLRGVRGERLIVRSREVTLRRPIQLLHPRHSLYVVPWGDGRYMIGATVIETEDDGPVTVRSALELLGGAYTLHSGFAEAEILEIGAGVRPAFPDNMPRVIVRDGGRHIFVNGAYRNGYLLAPVLAKAVAAYLDSGARANALVEVV